MLPLNRRQSGAIETHDLRRECANSVRRRSVFPSWRLRSTRETQGAAPMKSATHYFLVLAAGGALSASLLAQGIQYDKIEIKTEKVAPNLYMLSGSENVDPGHPDGAGGRIGILAGPDGIFMVDAQYLQIGEKVLAAIKKIDPGPIRFLANTHLHADHTAGNA